MELTFEKIGDWYISEFEVTSDFNLHIEKEPKGDFYLYQRTSSSGQYDIIEDFGYKKGGDNVIDLDFQALVYPKWIKIKSAVKPLVATITTDGEVNEVVYQAKDIEITSNGTTKVTADTGYTALGSVNVKVNVPQSGGGNGGNSGGEGGSDWHYFDVSALEPLPKTQVLQQGMLFKLQGENIESMLGSSMIMPVGIGYSLPDIVTEIKAIAIDYAAEVKMGEQTAIIGESITTAPWYGTVPEITKEEFYNLNA